ncbi:TrbI/VirB10 family protein [Marinobacter alkaliphilus]|uniref:TrbI/VirB10 family protein n=1 Tax=Marinobacter alkaliphilus TaxID=254719 RepID=A0ABZ3EAD1_9GAMM
MESIKNYWIGLDAKKKRYVVSGIGLAVAVALLSNFLFKEPIQREDRIRASTVSLTGVNEERFGMEALERRIRQAEARNEELQAEVRKASEAEELRKEFNRMMEEQRSTIAKLERQLDTAKSQPSSGEPGISEEEIAAMLEAAKKEWRETEVAVKDASGTQDMWDDESAFQTPVRPTTGVDAARNPQGAEQPAEPPFKLITIESAVKDRSVTEEDSRRSPQYLPAGSIISGVLVTGLDAPTNQESRAEPHPALLRIKRDTIMPNFYSSDFSECFALISGYGEMSSERAYLRSEVLSCIDSEGVAVEVPLKSFAVGEDGSAGVRGKLVNREGKLIAQSLLAGTLSAMSRAFGSTPVPTIVTSDTGGVQPFQQNLSSDALQSAGARGVGEALDRIADYYIDLADQIFPVLEIKSGREIDLVLTSGIEIDFLQ